MKIALAFASSIVALSTLVASARAGTATKPRASSVASICKINSNPAAFLGKVVVVSAVYHTDSSHYEYLEDPSCSSNNILDIGFRVPQRDASVAAFEHAKAIECQRTHQQFVCVLDGPVTVRGKIAQSKGAHLQPDAIVNIINLHSVINSWLQHGR